MKIEEFLGKNICLQQQNFGIFSATKKSNQKCLFLDFVKDAMKTIGQPDYTQKIKYFQLKVNILNNKP